MELYIHIPFCIRKCRYCSFTSYVGKEAYAETYIRLLIREAEERQKEQDRPIRTVYIGGGTPSILTPAQLKNLVTGLHSIFGLNEVSEFSCEANPGTLSPSWIETAASCGINRLSIGMQASQDSLLQVLGRIHRAKEVQDSVILCQSAGITNINLDLMFGIPFQGLRDWKDTLSFALSLKPMHISAYGLIPEEGTPIGYALKNGSLVLPDPDEERNMYDTAISMLKDHGFEQYEISNFAVPGFECIHNIGYWEQTPYIGLGVSAASMTHVRNDTRGMSYQRRTNPYDLETYRRMTEEKTSFPEIEQIGPKEACFETMMLGLRMNRGIRELDFQKMHGISMEQRYGRVLHRLENAGLLQHEKGVWKMTRRGFDIQNSILIELMDV